MDMTKNSSQRAAKFPNLVGGGFGILWLLFWSAITLSFDGVWLWMAATQSLTWTYASTEGTVLESRIERGADSDGDATYDAKIRYEYDAQGQSHRGDTVRNFSMRMNGGRQEAQRIVKRFPVGKRVTVYYDPARPGQSVLKRGLRGGDFFLPLFMTPFNIIMLGGWYAIVGSWRKNARPAGLRIRDDGLKVAAKLYNVTPLTAAVVAVMISSFVLIFVCGFGMMALPADWLVTGAWCVVLGSALLAWSRFRQPATTLEYDHFSGRVTIAKSGGQSHAFTIADIVAVGRDDTPAEPDFVDEDDDEDDDDDETAGEESLPAEDDEAAVVYRPSITYRDAAGKEQTVALANWSSADAVTWLVSWLKETLRVKD
ncbi:MAG TPA: DUF3592 domain-containing protein [Pirellulaceae bacterium]|nr:DUF3592 domain-containing protein [Pirellulaceae bacterium]